MSRWIAAFLVILTAIAFSAAQDTGEKPLRFPFGSSKSQVPFDVIQVDGKTAWRVAGRGNVKIEELIAAYSSATGKLVSYEADAAGVARGSVPYIGPDGGVVIEQGELGDYVSGLIAAAQITLVGHSTDKVHIVSISNAPGYARVIEASELAGLPDSEWVTIARADLANSGNVLRYALEHYRRSSVQIASQGEMFVATGRVEQIRNVNRIIEKLDKAPSSDGSEVRAYDLGAGGNAAQAMGVINALFDEPDTRVQNLDGKYSVVTGARKRVHVSAVPNSTKLLVRASTADHTLVKAALDAMK